MGRRGHVRAEALAGAAVPRKAAPKDRRCRPASPFSPENDRSVNKRQSAQRRGEGRPPAAAGVTRPAGAVVLPCSGDKPTLFPGCDSLRQH